VRETRADTTQALVLALGLHVLLFLLAFLGLWWTRTNAQVSAAGPVIEAELIDASALSASMRRTLRARPEPVPPVAEPEPEPEPVEQETAPPPQPLPEPAPQDSPVPPQQRAQDVVPVPDTVEQEAVSREAIAGEAREREQEAKRRQEQIDLTERKRQEEAERKQRLSEMEEMRQEQLADIRRRKAAATREAELAEAKLKQLQDYQREQAATDAAGAATPPPGNNGIDEDLRARWIAAMLRAIERQWVRPETAQAGVRCPIRIRMLPGGTVSSAEVQPSCPFDELARRSVERAVLKASPLPYAGFETVTARDFVVNFIAPR